DNGSGLYDASRFTAEQVVAILRALYIDFRTSNDFAATLAVAGADGTLQHRMAKPPAQFYVRAKSGTLNGVTCLSGYAGGTTAGPPVVAFAILINGYPDRAHQSARALIEEAAAALALYATKP